MKRILHSPLRRQIALFSFVRMVVNTSYRMIYPFLPAFSRGLGVDLTTLSLALTGRSLVGAFGPFLATITDTKGRKSGMLGGLLLFSAGSLLVVLYPTYPAFFAALILTTLGKYVFDPAMQAFLGDRVPYDRRGRVLAVTEIGWSLSFIIGIPLIGFIIARMGWLSPFYVLLLLSVLLVILISRYIPNENVETRDNNSLWRNIRSVLRHPPALAGLAVGLLITAANEMVNLIFGVWMEDTFGLQIIALGAASAVIGFAELGGEALMGVFVDRVGKVRSIAAGVVLNSLSAILLPIIGSSVPGALIGLFLFYITFEFTLISIIPLMTELMPSARATLLAFNVSAFSLGRAAGALLGPALYASGFFVSAEAAILFNMLALVVIRWLPKDH